MTSPTDTPKRSADQLLAAAADMLNVSSRMDHMELGAEITEFRRAAQSIPSQGKMERAREVFFQKLLGRQPREQFDDLMGHYRFSEIKAALDTAITQALTESSGQMGPEAAAILRTLGCVPDSTDLSETDAKVSVGFLRRLIGSSGQGTDGACCEAMREAAAKKVEGEVIHHRFRTWPWWGDGNRDKQDALVQFCDLCAKAIRALPPSPVKGRDAVLDECARIAKGVEKKSRIISGFWQRDDKQFYQRGLRDAAKEIRLAIRALKSTPHQGGERK